VQNTIIERYQNDSDVTAVLWNQGGFLGETQSWLQTWWDNHCLRGTVLHDANGLTASTVYGQPSLGLPFERGFIIGRDGRVLEAYFGHRPNWVVKRIEQLRKISLDAASPTLSAATGGSVDLFLTAGLTHGQRSYVLAGSLSGTTPGTPLPGGSATLPLNWDPFTSLVLEQINTPTFSLFAGSLDAQGNATAQLNLPALVPALIGTRISFAYALSAPFDYASTPVVIEIVP